MSINAVVITDSDFEECKVLFSKKLGKEYSAFTVFEKAVLADITSDKARGRLSKFLQWGTAERNGFLNWLEGLSVEYPELSDPERWAYEDAFGYEGDM